ncbi:MAG: hypothetical protein ACJ8HI_17900 [Massilia sp.]
MNSSRISLSLTILAGILINSSARANDCKLITHYCIKLPAGYSLKNITPPAADFELLELYRSKDRNEKLTVYFGNAPSFPVYDWGNSSPMQKRHEVARTWLEYDGKNGAIEGVLNFSGLSYRGSSQSPYSQVHYFGRGLDAESGAQLKAIIVLITVFKPILD